MCCHCVFTEVQLFCTESTKNPLDIFVSLAMIGAGLYDICLLWFDVGVVFVFPCLESGCYVL